MILVAAALLTASINVELDLGALIHRTTAKQPTVTCGISTVGYRFSGKPGQAFRYAGDTYQVPAEGWVELIADKRRTTYSYNGRSLPLDVWPKNQFGFREVPLPSPDQTADHSSNASPAAPAVSEAR
jgi:hypothetical protein